jgi:hypothetical protein
LKDKRITTGPDGLLYLTPNQPVSAFVDSARLAEVNFPNADLILLRLYDSGGPESRTGAQVPPEHAHQFRLSADTARRLAHDLLQAADRIDGHGASRQ